MILRPATPNDAPACAAILGGFFETTPWLPRLHTAEQDGQFMARMIGLGQVTVATQDAEVLGYLAVDGTELDHLYLAPNARRLGIGSQLVSHAKSGRDLLTLWCFRENRAARAFYAHHGFVETARTDGDNEEGQPDVRLQWGSM